MSLDRELGLGRREFVDERDENFLMSSVVSEAPSERTYRYWWPNGMWGDQGATPQCVGYSWAHWLEDGPVTHIPKRAQSGFKILPRDIYSQAQTVDEWPGEDYAGTSVRAGAKILNRYGLIEEYRWAWSLQPVVDALLTSGPVVIGSWWYTDMFRPNSDGLVEIGGSRAGGHAYVLNGINRNRGIVRGKNSWGRSWGKDGYFYMSFEDLERLIEEGGEACLAVEVGD